ncbi:MAG: tRNA 2-selenouridine(34) synthase MnmH [Halieaceae bacterium]|nr:tRNA 2-selenouridine(34) synthase MnmH [Halieaceae bacterium]
MASQITDFKALFLNDTPLIDTRAPIEFIKGSFPKAVNLPLMMDDERAAVGTEYKQKGQDAAIALGHNLVSGSVKDQRIAAWRDFTLAHPNGALFCFRGGMRSHITQQWLRESGADYPLVTGGYKALRTWLMEELTRTANNQNIVVLAGRTGVAKTVLLNQIPSHYALGALDLEGLAHHRGSAFGRRPSPQPTQINFEIALAIAMLKHEAKGYDTLILEDESQLIGRCAIPAPLLQQMQQASLWVLEAPIQERVEHSYHAYILSNLEEWTIQLEPQEAAFKAFSDSLERSAYSIRKRLGGIRYAELNKRMSQALDEHRQGNPEAHKKWIHFLLTDYYDPMYDYQLSKRGHRIESTGDRVTLMSKLQQFRV